MRGRDSSVSIATRYGLEVRGSNPGAGRDFPHSPWPALGAHPASYTMDTGSFQGVKRPGRGVDHLPQSSAEVKESVELYLYNPSGPSWPVIGWNLPFPLWFAKMSDGNRLMITARRNFEKLIEKNLEYLRWIKNQYDCTLWFNFQFLNDTKPLWDSIYILTPWSRVLLEKLTGSQLVKNSPTFYGTRIFITAVTSARHLSLSCPFISGSLSPRHGASLGCGWRNGLQYGG